MMVFAKCYRGLASMLLALALGGLTAAGNSPSKQDGDRLQKKIDAIVKNGSAIPVPAKKTSVSENEVNSYLTFNLREKIPRGLAGPQITVVGNGRLAGRISVDIDEFNRQRQSRSLLDPLNYLSGQVPITARGLLGTRDGQGLFQLESADIHGVPLPKPIVQELVSFFSRTRDNPRGFDIDRPFKLPASIREVAINAREAVVVQ